MSGRTELDLQIEAGLMEALAHRKGTLALKSRHVEAMPAARVREIRRSLAKSTKAFERRFGIPARTVEGWEQGRKIDVAHRVLLMVIAKSPDVVEAALTEAC
jgi:putative transcriptional regulator